MAREMQDTNLIAKFLPVIWLRLSANTNTKCILAYQRKYTAFTSSSESTTCHIKVLKARAFVELVSYMERMVESEEYVFELSKLHSLYSARLNELHADKNVLKTRLKNEIFEYFHGEFQEQTDGKSTVLIFKRA